MTISRIAVALLCVSLGWASQADAQIASRCLKPVAIADRWDESQTPPWDSSDTYTAGDTYAAGFVQPDDQGGLVSLRLGGASGSAVPLRLEPGNPGAQYFFDSIVDCPATSPYPVGGVFAIESGNLIGPMMEAFNQLIATDPTALWDPAANDGKGGVAESAFTVSPRLVALPVYDPAVFAASQSPSEIMVVKIVGFFVSHTTNEGGVAAVHGYLTGLLDISMPPLTGNSGDLVTVYATVLGPGLSVKDVPIEFAIDNTPIGTALTSEAGIASIENVAIPDLPPGNHAGAVTARVSAGAGSGFFISQIESADLRVLGIRETTTTVATTPNPSTFGDAVTIHVTVAGDDQIPGGLVELFDGDRSLGTAPLAEGTAIFGPLQLSSGTHIFRAAYLGDASNQFSSSAPVTHVVQQAQSATALTVSPSTSVFGQSIILTARVSSPAGMPGGVVSFAAGGTQLGSVALAPAATGSDGVASIIVTSLNAGTHALTATYHGAANFLASSAPPVSHSIAPSASTVQLSSTPNPSKSGQAVSLRAVVAPVSPGGGTPTGVVQFLAGTSVIATGSLSSGVATAAVGSLKVGKHQLTARYLGTANYTESVSAAITQTVKGGK